MIEVGRGLVAQIFMVARDREQNVIEPGPTLGKAFELIVRTLRIRQVAERQHADRNWWILSPGFLDLRANNLRSPVGISVPIFFRLRMPLWTGGDVASRQQDADRLLLVRFGLCRRYAAGPNQDHSRRDYRARDHGMPPVVCLAPYSVLL